MPKIDHEQILDQIGVGVLQTTVQGEILWVNSHATTLSGFISRDEFLKSTSIARWKNIEDRDRFISALKTFGKVQNFAAEVLNVDNQTVWILINANLCDNNIIATILDITAHKKQEEELLRSRVHLEEARRIAKLGSWEWDIKQNEAFWSKEMFQILDLQEISSPSLNQLVQAIHESDRSFVENAMHEAVQNGKGFDLDVRVIWADGSEHIVHVQGEPSLDELGNTHRMMGTMQDITERKLTEKQLHQAQKLESIGQLAAGIAHEINTPTQYIGDNLTFLKESSDSFSDLWNDYAELIEAIKAKKNPDRLLRKIAEKQDAMDVEYLLEEIPDAITQANDGIARITKIVSATKEFSHPGDAEKTLVDLNQALDTTITVSKNEWKYIADIETDFDVDLPRVNCLAGEMNQVFLNIIVNAAHAIEEKQKGSGKGKIVISTRTVVDDVEITISDTGGGIPDNIKNRVFDPFFTTKSLGKGTGQGLAIAYSILKDKHDGQLYFDSKNGVGTTFTIRLPMGT